MIGWLILGAVVLLPVAVKKGIEHLEKRKKPPALPPAGGFAATPSHDRPEACLPPGSSVSVNPTGGQPEKGIASSFDYQWCHIVRDGDTAGRIAEKIVGDRNRYVELLAANPSKERIGSPEVNFKTLDAGGSGRKPEMLFLPKSWNPWIDQKGNIRGQKTPFPPYDKLVYPAPVMTSAGHIPWPPSAPTGWMMIPPTDLKTGP
jgi:hypothetical protein